MEKFDELTRDYSTEPVPDEELVSGVRVGLINSALCMTMPSVVVGAQLGQLLGFRGALLACLIVLPVLTLIGTLTGMVGARSGISSYVIFRFSFGVIGSRLISLILAVSMFGWFGINLSLFGDAVAGIGASFGFNVPSVVTMLLGGLLMTVIGIFGFRALDTVAIVLAPILALVIALLSYQALQESSISELMQIAPTSDNSLATGLGILVGGLIVIAAAQPDLTRYTRSASDSFWAVALPFALAQPFVVLGVSLASLTSENDDVIAIMLESGLGVWALLLVISSSFVANAINLYGCSLSLAAIIPDVRKWVLAVIAGLGGTLAGVLGIMDHVIGFLFVLAVVVSPVAGIYSVDYFWLKRRHYDVEAQNTLPTIGWRAYAALAIGIAAAQLTTAGIFSITSIAAFDSLLAAMLCYGLLNYRAYKRD